MGRRRTGSLPMGLLCCGHSLLSLAMPSSCLTSSCARHGASAAIALPLTLCLQPSAPHINMAG